MRAPLHEYDLQPLDHRLLNDFQHDFPLDPRPYRILAERLGIAEAEVLERLGRLQLSGHISRVGAVLRARRVGVSTLAAMRVPEERLEVVAGIVNGFPEVNHNYEREHGFNLWFVITARSAERLAEVTAAIEAQTGLAVCSMPMEADFHIDLGFQIHG
ncbi:MAG: AsnC family transcriptional regulator [Magnetococcus sp. YQC-9]